MIKNCPLCESEAQLYIVGEDGGAVNCSLCGFHTAIELDADLAVDRWNRRSELFRLDGNGVAYCACCGGKAYICEVDVHGDILYTAVCSECHVSSCLCDTPEEAKLYWNARPKSHED